MMNSVSGLRIGTVHIIESLRPCDLRTGDRLHAEIGPLAGALTPAITVQFWREATRASFLDRLQMVAAAIGQDGRAPVVHIEAHGDFDGIQLTSGECITWSDLKGPLTRINVACRLNLLVLAGACD